MRLTRMATFCGLFAFVSHTSIINAAENATPVINWRGSDASGAVTDGSYPTQWSVDKNMAWKIDLPGRGGSSPIAIGDRIVTTSADQKSNYLFCLDANGKIDWQLEIGAAAEFKHKKASAANSSPVSDGSNIYAYFKSGDIVACTMDGKKLWQVNLQEKYGKDTLWWDLGTSPILVDNAVVIAVMQEGPSYLLALDKANGNELWKSERVFKVSQESDQAYTTPAVGILDGQKQIFTLGADHLTAHDAKGKQLWALGGFNASNQNYFRSIASPVIAGNIVICPYSRGDTLTGVRTEAGLDEEKRVAWFRNDVGSDVPTPAVADGHLFVLDDSEKIWILDPQTGKTVKEIALPKHRRSFSSSPIYSNGKLYCMREDATTFVVDIESGEIVATNELEGETVATPLLANNHVFIRTYESLYCIGE